MSGFWRCPNVRLWREAAGLLPTDLTRAAVRAKAAMVDLEQPLNVADAKLGDGDTGGMLARLTDALAAVPVQQDVGLQFTTFGKAALTATGSSLGTVCAGALMAIGRETAGREFCSSRNSAISSSLRAMRCRRGGRRRWVTRL